MKIIEVPNTFRTSPNTMILSHNGKSHNHNGKESSIFDLVDSIVVEQKYIDMAKQWHNDPEFREQKRKNLIDRLSARMNRRVFNNMEKKKASRYDKHAEKVKEMISYLRNEGKLGIAGIAEDELFVTPNNLKQAIRVVYDVNVVRAIKPKVEVLLAEGLMRKVNLSKDIKGYQFIISE
jgi:hypothetical protein